MTTRALLGNTSSPRSSTSSKTKCMNQLLYSRSLGSLGPQAFARIQTAQLIHAVQPCLRLQFDGGEKEAALPDEEDETGHLDAAPKIWAHQAGTNALALDVDGRLLISGGSDPAIKLWNLEEPAPGSKHSFKPIGKISPHKFGITNLSFYPFDSAAFLSTSFDHRLKLYSTESLSVSAEFDLKSIPYTHALSPIANHLLVACATQHPAVRLVDLRSGDSTHSLPGHHGALLAVKWSPTVEHILASGGVDGTVRLWDVRKSSGSLGVLDMEDSIGVTGTDGMGRSARSREHGKSHGAAVNGISWTDDGQYIVTAGHDNKVRVWDACTGANTLASLGPTIRNGHLSTLNMATTPTSCTPPGKELLFFPNEKEILMFELHEGRLLKRLKVPGPVTAAVRSRTGERNVKNRITGLVWRGLADGLYSSHTDGQIRAWLPRTVEDDLLDKEEEEGLKRKSPNDEEEGNRKRQVLDTIFRDLTKQKITFG